MAQKKKRSVKAELIEQIGDGTYTTRNHELERKVLKQLFSQPDQIGIISATLGRDHFTDPRYKDIYDKAISVYKQGRIQKSDPSVVLAECLRSPSDEIEPEDYRAAVEEIFREDRDVDINQAVLTLNNLLVARRFQALSHELISKASSGEDINTLIAEASGGIRSISINANMDDSLYDLDRLLSEQERGAYSLIEPDFKGIATPFPLLNDMIDGFEPGELYIVAGRPGMGKTALLGQIGYHSGATGNQTVFYPLEMSGKMMWTRAMCCHCNVTGSDVKKLELTAIEKAACEHWMHNNPAKKNLRFSDKSGRTPMQIRADLIRHKDKYGEVKLVIVDQLQLMHSGTGHRDRREEVSYLSRAMKELASEFQIPVILASAMNREYERRQGKDKRPELSDLNESGQIESDASVVLFTHRPSVTRPPNDPDPPDDEIICRKNRNGPQGIVKVKFNGPYFRFENLPDKRI